MTVSDLISRQDATRWVKTECNPYGKPTLDFESGKRVMEHLEQMPSAEPEQYGRVFNGIVVEYPSINTYPEYEGKPYFQIKYTENGREFIGYGTYKPEVLSEFLKEYFMPSAEPKTGKWVRREKIGLDADDIESCLYYWYECSECGNKPPCDSFRNEWHSSYCPSCGARMTPYKGGEDE